MGLLRESRLSSPQNSLHHTVSQQSVSESRSRPMGSSERVEVFCRPCDLLCCRGVCVVVVCVGVGVYVVDVYVCCGCVCCCVEVCFFLFFFYRAFDVFLSERNHCQPLPHLFLWRSERIFHRNAEKAWQSLWWRFRMILVFYFVQNHAFVSHILFVFVLESDI